MGFVLIEKFYQSVNGAIGEDDVLVEEERVFSGDVRKCGVVSFGVAEVLTITNEFDGDVCRVFLGLKFFQKLYCAIGRSVIYEDELGGDLWWEFPK